MDPLLDLVHFRNCGWAFCSWPEQKKMMWICQKSDFTALSTVFFKAAANKTHGRFWKDIPPTNTHQYFFLYQKHLQPKAKKPIWRTLFFPNSFVSFLFRYHTDNSISEVFIWKKEENLLLRHTFPWSKCLRHLFFCIFSNNIRNSFRVFIKCKMEDK